MARLNFKQRLAKLDLDEVPTPAYETSLNGLKEITDAIQERFNRGLQGDPIHVDVEPGFQAQMSRQLNVKLRFPDKNYQDGLFRAYIPDKGTPVQLDLYGEDLKECNDDDELQDALMVFIAKIKDRIVTYRRAC